MMIVTAAIVLAEVSTGAALRTIEVERGINAQFVADGYQRFVSQPSLKASGMLPVGAIIGGDEKFCGLVSIVRGTRPLAGYAAFLSPGLSDQEWEAREALNAHLEGVSEQDFRKQAITLPAGRERQPVKKSYGGNGNDAGIQKNGRPFRVGDRGIGRPLRGAPGQTARS
jgi:hypothetical protein